MYGGQEVSIEQVPFQVAILTNSRFCCGGSLISWNFVLSAAHNFGDSYNPEHYSVKVGTSVLNDGSGLTINVKRIITHHKYNEHKIDYDFALMQLEDVYEFPKVVQFARLPSIFDKLFDGDEVFVSGWGMTETGKSSDVLLGGTAKIFNFEKCYEANAGFLTSRMICAVHENGVTSPCIGDSGGPLFRESDGLLFGVTSFGDGCGYPKSPDVYAKVTSALDWIYDVMNYSEDI